MELAFQQGDETLNYQIRDCSAMKAMGKKKRTAVSGGWGVQGGVRLRL